MKSNGRTITRAMIGTRKRQRFNHIIEGPYMTLNYLFSACLRTMDPDLDVEVCTDSLLFSVAFMVRRMKQA
jgi:hypothetical protein